MNDSFASEADLKITGGVFVEPPITDTYVQLTVSNLSYGHNPTKVLVIRGQDERFLTLQMEESKQFTVRNAEGLVIYFIKKQHTRMANRVWYIHNSQGQVVYSAKSRIGSTHDKVYFYRGQVQFSRFTGQAEGGVDEEYTVSRPAPNSIRNLQMHKGIHLVADADEKLGTSNYRDMAVRIQAGNDCAFVILALLMSDATKEGRYSPFEQVPASPAIRPAVAPSPTSSPGMTPMPPLSLSPAMNSSQAPVAPPKLELY